MVEVVLEYRLKVSPYSYISLAGTLEEESYDEHLESSHSHHHRALDKTEVENSCLSTSHCREVPVLTSTEVLLVANDGTNLRRDLEYRLLESGSLFRAGPLLLRKRGTIFVLNLVCPSVSVPVACPCGLCAHSTMSTSFIPSW